MAGPTFEVSGRPGTPGLSARPMGWAGRIDDGEPREQTCDVARRVRRRTTAARQRRGFSTARRSQRRCARCSNRALAAAGRTARANLGVAAAAFAGGRRLLPRAGRAAVPTLASGSPHTTNLAPAAGGRTAQAQTRRAPVADGTGLERPATLAPTLCAKYRPATGRRRTNSPGRPRRWTRGASTAVKQPMSLGVVAVFGWPNV